MNEEREGGETMTTDKHAWVSAHAKTAVLPRTSHPVCACGQDLDICARQHCPRCGATIS
jgi:hypothetical protein